MKSRPESHRRALRLASPLAIRRGYTMIELLVVISIMSILISLITIGGVGFIRQARVAATQTTIKKVDEAVQERVGAVNRWHMRPINRLRHDWEIRGWTNRWTAYGLDPFAGTGASQEGSDDVKMVLSRKGMLIELLPVTRAELKQAYWFWARFINPAVPQSSRIRTINGVPVFYLSASEEDAMDAWLDDIDPSTPGNQSLDTPGEVFLYALQNAPVFGAERMAEEDFTANELIDPDEDGVPELGDSWGNPIRFYRWPTRLVNGGEFTLPRRWSDNVALKTLIPNAPSESPVPPPPAPPVQWGGDLHQDPDDRAGYLSLTNPIYNGPISLFFHDIDTWHAPLVVSAGPDGELGLQEPDFNDPIGPAGRQIPRYGLAQPLGGDEALFDNISNHNSNGGL